MNGYIYKIYSPDNKLNYYGLTKNNIYCRLSSHIKQYRLYKIGSSNNCASFKIFDEYGVDYIKIDLVEKLENTTDDELLEREIFYINNFNCVNIRNNNNKDIKKFDWKQALLYKKEELIVNIKDFLNLNRNNLNEFENNIFNDEKKLLKAFNLYIYLSNDYPEDKMYNSQIKKINICKKLMESLNINNFNELNKDIISKNTSTIIENTWINDNLDYVKRILEIRTNKYDNFEYYNIYLLFITVIKNLFDIDLFLVQMKQINKNEYCIYSLNNKLMNKYNQFFDTIDN